MQTTIADVLRLKGGDVLTIGGTATVYEAIEQMEHERVGSIIVMDDDEVVGIFTERDYLRRIVLKGRTSKTTQVQEVMTRELVCVDPSYSVQECMAVMTDRKIRHLPVIDDGRLAGIVSIGDLVKTISDEAQARVHYLTDYITGKYPA
ncbi:MAG: CBS domain-containing protein [Rhodothermales bacterium]|nr:CBS domain-containing protein [Rhodothermales bacterium]